MYSNLLGKMAQVQYEYFPKRVLLFDNEVFHNAAANTVVQCKECVFALIIRRESGVNDLRGRNEALIVVKFGV